MSPDTSVAQTGLSIAEKNDLTEFEERTVAAEHGSPSSMYSEALQRYPNDASIDIQDEKRLVRKLDLRLLLVLGICYFFYVSDLGVLTFSALFSLLFSTLTKRPYLMPLSSESRKTWLCRARNIRGFPVSSTSDGLCGQFHPTSSCRGSPQHTIWLSTFSSGASSLWHKRHRKVS